MALQTLDSPSSFLLSCSISKKVQGTEAWGLSKISTSSKWPSLGSSSFAMSPRPGTQSDFRRRGKALCGCDLPRWPRRAWLHCNRWTASSSRPERLGSSLRFHMLSSKSRMTLQRLFGWSFSQHIQTSKNSSGLVAQVPTRDDALHELFKALARVEGDDRRRCFLGAQAMIISSRGHSASDHLIVLGQAIGQAGDGSDVELCTSLVLPRVEEVQASVSAHRPVGMLSTAIDASKGLLMEKHLEPQLLRLSVHDLHKEHVAVARDVGSAEDWRHLVLSWGHLVVLHSHRTANLQHLGLSNVQQLLNLPWDGLEVVQVSLLMARGQFSEQSSATIHQVRSSFVEISRHHKEFLFPSQVAEHGLCISSNVNGLQQAQATEGHGIHGAKQRSLLIDAFAEVGDKGTRDVEALVGDKWWGCAIPSGECSCRMGHSQPTIWERRSIGLTLEQTFMWQAGLHWLGHILGSKLQIDQGVLFEGSQHATNCTTSATQREEPVSKINGTQLTCPIEDGISDDLLILLRGWCSTDEALVESLQHGTRQLLGHDCVIKHGSASSSECVSHRDDGNARG